MPFLVIFVAEGPLKKLYERIRSQRDNWQQRSLQESYDADAAVDGSRTESAIHKATTDKEGQAANLMHVFCQQHLSGKKFGGAKGILA